MTDIVDYARDDYMFAFCNDYGDIFHITNLTYFKEHISSHKIYYNMLRI